MARSDEELKELVEAELAWEPTVDPAGIGVSVEQGVVTLYGTVHSFAEKGTAVLAAKRVLGVRMVVDKLEVKLRDDQRRSDEEIASRAEQALIWFSVAPPGMVAVAVHDGIVTLSGEVKRQFQRNSAENAVKHVRGVRAVVNEVKLTPPRVSPDKIQRDIGNAFQRGASLDARTITAEVEGGRVTLRGMVRTLAEYDAAEEVAWQAPGVTQVINEIVVQPAPWPEAA